MRPDPMCTRRLRSMLRAIAAMLVLGVATAAVADGGDAALHEAVRRANAEWAQAVKTGDAAVIAAPYARDAVFVLADGRVVQGRANIEALYREGFRTGGVARAATIDSRSLWRDGDFAYESGSADLVVLRQGQPVARAGRYVTVWQEQADGTWKIVRNLVL